VTADLEIAVEGGVATVWLSRIDKKNAITIEMADELTATFDSFRRDPDVRVVVLTGAGRAFCGGGDLGRIAEHREPAEHRRRLVEHMHEVAFALERFDKPVIAAVNGDAFGAGMDLALMCDIRFAARSARFSDGYVLVGLVPGDGACWYLPRIVGTSRALELLLTGDTIDAARAAELGIVNRVVDDDRLADEAAAFAGRLADRPSGIVSMIKRCLYESARSDLRTSLDLVASHMGIARSMPESAEQLARFQRERANARSSSTTSH
jgi:enoyl-CoA hydratase/carnithine racemase